MIIARRFTSADVTFACTRVCMCLWRRWTKEICRVNVQRSPLLIVLSRILSTWITTVISYRQCQGIFAGESRPVKGDCQAVEFYWRVGPPADIWKYNRCYIRCESTYHFQHFALKYINRGENWIGWFHCSRTNRYLCVSSLDGGTEIWEEISRVFSVPFFSEYNWGIHRHEGKLALPTTLPLSSALLFSASCV